MNEESKPFRPRGGFPTQSELVFSRSVSRFNYAIRPPENISRSDMPEWKDSLIWVLASPAIGYHTTFAEYLVHIYPGGGCPEPEPELGVESFIYILECGLSLEVNGKTYELPPGGYALLPAGMSWTIRNPGDGITKFIWVRKIYQPLKDLHQQLLVGNEIQVESFLATGHKGWEIKRLLPVEDFSIDMCMNLVSFDPGGVHAYLETHPEEHGLYIIEGQGVYYLGNEWHEVMAGDFIWMRPYCPQSFYAGGATRTRYLLYKNANRQIYLGCRNHLDAIQAVD
jgi:(S)-ureidoglycine aminohydrolase